MVQLRLDTLQIICLYYILFGFITLRLNQARLTQFHLSECPVLFWPSVRACLTSHSTTLTQFRKQARPDMSVAWFGLDHKSTSTAATTTWQFLLLPLQLQLHRTGLCSPLFPLSHSATWWERFRFELHSGQVERLVCNVMTYIWGVGEQVQ